MAKILFAHEQNFYREQVQASLGVRHQLSVSCSLREAAKLIWQESQENFDLIICDAYLGEGADLSVFDLLSWIQKHKKIGNAMFVLVSLEASSEAIRCGNQLNLAGKVLGISDYWMMPYFDVDELDERVNQALTTMATKH